MADVKNKRVDIYIDQSSAISALDSLQKKADGFNKKIDDARTKQTQLLESIKRSETAAANIDSLRTRYAELGKEIDRNKKSLQSTKEEYTSVKQQLTQLTDKLVDAKNKQADLAEQIVKSTEAGKSTVRLQQQFEAVGKEIDRTVDKINVQTRALNRLEKENIDAANAVSRLKQEQAGVKGEIKIAGNAVQTIKDAEKQYKSLSTAIDSNSDSLNKNKVAQAAIQTQIDAGLRPSLEATRNQVTKLKNELAKMSEDAPGYAEKFESFQKADLELERLENSFRRVHQAQRSWMQDAKTVAFGVLIGNTVQSAVEAVGSYLSGIVSGNAKLSDSITDIEKSTGKTTAEVVKLNKEISSIDTRTANKDLRDIAIGLGQINEEASKSNIEALNKTIVALRDEFTGDANQITNEMSVLRNNMQDIKTGNYADDILHISNAINELGANGLAIGQTTVNIANRTAGVAQTFGVSSGAILGLAATFQELGIAEERGSTAYIRILQKISTEPAKFAKVAGMGIKQFTKLVNEDMQGAFTAVAEGAKKAGTNNIIFGKILKELDADGSGAGEVLSKIAANSQLLADKTKLASDALKNTDSITSEYNKKNNNLAAEIEKLKKVFSSFIQSKTLIDFFTAAIKGASGFINVLRALPGFITNNKTAIALLLIGIATLNAHYIKAAVLITRDTALRIYNATVTRAGAIATNLAIAAQAAYIQVTGLLTGRIALATAAQRLWNIALSLGAGPIGVIIVAAGALVLGLTNLLGTTKALTAEQKALNAVQVKAAEDTANQKSNIDAISQSLKGEVLSLDEKKKLLDKLIAVNPAYLSGLTLENIKTAEGKKIIDDYIISLDRMARAKALQSVKEDAYKASVEKSIKAEQTREKTNTKTSLFETIGESILAPFGSGAAAQYKRDILGAKEANEDLAAVNKTIGRELDKQNELVGKQQLKVKGLKKDSQEYKNELVKLNDLVKTRNVLMGIDENVGTVQTAAAKKDTATDPFANKPDKSVERDLRKEQSDRERLLKQLKDFQFELSQVGKMADESEIDRITKKYNELIEKATRYGVSYIEIEKEKNRAIAVLIEQEAAKRKEIIRKNQLQANEDTYKSFQQDAVESGESKKEQKLQEYSKGLLTKQQFEDAIRKIDIDTLDFQIKLAESLVGVSKQASEDIVKLKKKKNREIIEDEIKTHDRQKELDQRNAMATAQINVALSPEGTKRRLDANIALLNEKRDQALANEDLTEREKEKIRIEFRQREAQAVIEFYAAQVQQTLEFISQGLDIVSKFNDAKTARENAAFNRELKQNEARKNSIKKLEDSKVISASESRRRIRAIELEEERKKEELEKRQQARAKRIAIAQAIINGALAVTSTLAALPGATDILSLGAFRAIQIGIAIATTAAQIATITSTKYAKGGLVEAPELRNGKIVTPSNIPTQSNGDNVLATVKTGEVILNEDQQNALGGPETFRKIGVPGFAGGGSVGTIKRFWEARAYKSLNFPVIKDSMQKNKLAESSATAGSDEPLVVTSQLSEKHEQLMEKQSLLMEKQGQVMEQVLYFLQNPVSPEIPLTKIEKGMKERERVAKLSEWRAD